MTVATRSKKLLGAKGIAPKNKKLLGAPGLTRNKDATRSVASLGNHGFGASEARKQKETEAEAPGGARTGLTRDVFNMFLLNCTRGAPGFLEGAIGAPDFGLNPSPGCEEWCLRSFGPTARTCQEAPALSASATAARLPMVHPCPKPPGLGVGQKSSWKPTTLMFS